MQMIREKGKKVFGLSLIELAIVLALIGLLMTIGMGIFKALVQSTKFSESRAYVRELKNAVMGYVITREKLPCDSSETCPSPQRRYNELARAIDSYGKAISYIYWGQLRDTSNICNETSTGLQVVLCGNDPACTTNSTIQDVAFVLVGLGDNRNKQTLGSGRTTTATSVKVYEFGTQADDDLSDGDASSEGYDDIVEYVTLYQVKDKLCQGGGQATCVHGTTPITVYNNTGATRCFNSQVVANGGTYTVNPGDTVTVTFYLSFFGCFFSEGSFTYNNAANTDANTNCEVNYDGNSNLSDR